MAEITGNLSDGIEALSKVLNLKGKVIPLTEDNVVLMGEMTDGSIIEGEHNITMAKKKISKVYYKEEATPTKEAINAIKEADLIILSMGSLFTSIIPNLICDDIIKALDESDAKIMYACNMMTQPGETDNFTVSDHVKLLNEYLGKHKVDVVIANSGEIEEELAKKYETLEQKDPVIFDKEELDKLNCDIINDNFFTVTNNLIRHDVIKLSLRIFSYLLGK